MKKIMLVILAFFILSMADFPPATPYSLAAANNPQEEFQTRREKMVQTQIKARKINDPDVLAALLKVERHRFVPAEYLALAYSDQPLPIGEGQTISQPYIVALMTELLALQGGEKVLEIGTGSGYQAAILAQLAKEVYTIEIVEPLAARAKNLLLELGYPNIKMKTGDGYLGWPEAAPFDAIIITCAPRNLPQPLIEQLKEGGRMVVPLGSSHSQGLKLIIKRAGKLQTTNIIPVLFVPMTGKNAEKNE